MTESDLPQYLRIIAALVFVLALMGGLSVILRRMGLMGAPPAPVRKRLKLVEVLTLDPRRRLAIIQRDEKQHLVIFGPSGETLIESGIETGQDGGANKLCKTVHDKE